MFDFDGANIGLVFFFVAVGTKRLSGKLVGTSMRSKTTARPLEAAAAVQSVQSVQFVQFLQFVQFVQFLQIFLDF